MDSRENFVGAASRFQGALLAMVVCTVLAIGCAGSRPRPTPPNPVSPTVPPAAEPLVREARRMLAEQVGASESDISLVAAEPREWPDTGLGCPEPGGAYAQVITPGYRIVLSRGDQKYTYHTSLRNVVHCPSDRG